jgi:hypothetical protein
LNVFGRARGLVLKMPNLKDSTSSYPIQRIHQARPHTPIVVSGLDLVVFRERLFSRPNGGGIKAEKILINFSRLLTYKLKFKVKNTYLKRINEEID